MRVLLVVVCTVGCFRAAPPNPPASSQAPVRVVPSCAETAAHLGKVYDPEGTATPTREVALRRCESDHWGDNARACLTKAATVIEARPCFDQLTDAQRKAMLDEHARAIAEHDDGSLPVSCQRYARAIEDLMACDKVPEEARHALRDSFEQVKAAWASVPKEGWDALEPACRAATDAVEQSSPCM